MRLAPQARVADSRVFLLSPARTDGLRAKLLFNPRATFPLAVRLRTPEGAELGEVFSFLSGLYFRGKLTYARAFASPPRRAPGILVITPERGLAPPETRVTIDDLHEFSQVDIAAGCCCGARAKVTSWRMFRSRALSGEGSGRLGWSGPVTAVRRRSGGPFRRLRVSRSMARSMRSARRP